MGAVKIKTTDADEMKKILNLICAQNDYIIKKIDEISASNVDMESINDIKSSMDIGTEIHDYFKRKELTYKQYYVLKYHLNNPYISDTHLSIETGVSYSSISQWKNKSELFRGLYDKIKSLK